MVVMIMKTNFRKILLILLFSGFSGVFGETRASNPSAYFMRYRALADSLSAVYKIPSCVILSVAYIESGGGTSKVAQKLNNHFGIVGKNNPSVSGLKSKYRHFGSIKDSYIGFCELISRKKFYSGMLSSNDEQLWLQKIAATGYAANATRWSNGVYRIVQTLCK